ncbi:MAG: HAD family hydrolase [Acholeplasmatales bacterium]|nr:HAD family hydrolase [Acholeplasmatales bacterium]
MQKLVIFDLDGTLLDTIADLNAALNHTLAEFNFTKISCEKTRELVGNGIRNLIIRASGTDSNIDLMFKCFMDYYNKNVNVYTKPYNNIKELIIKLKNIGFKLAVVSNKNIIPLKTLVNYHFKDLFDLVLGDGMGYKRKPDSEIINECIKKLDSDLEHTIYIGDSDVDVKTVNNTGCHGIFVSYGFRDKEKLIEAGAKTILDNVSDLSNYLLKVEL